jgi:hypothetical protein
MMKRPIDLGTQKNGRDRVLARKIQNYINTYDMKDTRVMTFMFHELASDLNCSIKSVERMLSGYQGGGHGIRIRAR